MKTLVSHTLNAKSPLVAILEKTSGSLSERLLNAVLGKFGQNIRNTKRTKVLIIVAFPKQQCYNIAINIGRYYDVKSYFS